MVCQIDNLMPMLPVPNGPSPPPWHRWTGMHTLFTLVCMVLPTSGSAYSPSPFCTSVCWTEIRAICCKYVLLSITFSHRLDQAMSAWTYLVNYYKISVKALWK